MEEEKKSHEEGFDPNKYYCNGCKKEVDVTEIEIQGNSKTVKMACGHKHVSIVFSETVKVKSFMGYKHKNPESKLLEKYKDKISGATKRDARDRIIIDRENEVKIHHIEELQDDGSWKIVYNEETPFSEQRTKSEKKEKKAHDLPLLHQLPDPPATGYLQEEGCGLRDGREITKKIEVYRCLDYGRVFDERE